MMKRALVLTAAILMTLALSACVPAPAEPTQPASAEPQLFTLAPADSSEPEWCPLDCDLALVDESGEEYAGAEEFLCFALEGSSDEDGRLLFKPTEELQFMLAADSVLHTWELQLDGESIGKAEATAAFDEFTLTGEYDTLCELATRIRGL